MTMQGLLPSDSAGRRLQANDGKYMMTTGRQRLEFWLARVGLGGQRLVWVRCGGLGAEGWGRN